MVLTPSVMTPLGSALPAFTLPEPLTGTQHPHTSLLGPQATVVIFMCNHCPFVVHLLDALLATARTYLPRGVAFIGISANDPHSYPDDAPEAMAQLAQSADFPFPYLYDASQSVARAFGAACTPDFFVYDSQQTLVYRGRFDASRPGQPTPVDGADLTTALESLLSDRPIPSPQLPSMGCNIKWLPQ